MTVHAAFREQAEHCADLGSPFTARLCGLFAERLTPQNAVAARLLAWPGDASGRADALPLRLCGALHALKLEDRDADLAAVYPPRDAGVSDDALWIAVTAALERHESFVLRRLEGPPQTNEPQRSGALAPGFLTVAALTGLPLVTSEIGASAGLNMVWDRFSYRMGSQSWGDAASKVTIAPEWQGPAPPMPACHVAARAGCDRAPPGVRRAEDRMTLLSFVWPDQEDRLARVRAAIDLARDTRVCVERAEAADWLEARLAEPHPGRAHVVYHSIVWQYLDAATQTRCHAALDGAMRRASAEAPVAWLRLEGDGRTPGAAITLTMAPGGETREIGRGDFHGRWIRWTGWQ